MIFRLATKRSLCHRYNYFWWGSLMDTARSWGGLLAFALVVAAVMSLVIFVGWYFVADHTLKLGGWSAVPAAAAVMAALLIARHAAGMYVTGGGRYSGRVILAGCALLAISATGTLAAIYVVFESKSIARQDMTRVKTDYERLLAGSRQQIVPASFDEHRARVDGLLANLKREINNPNPGYCGFGPQARAIFGALQSEIPSLRLLNGSTPFDPCDPVRGERLFRDYADMAAELLPNLPQYSAVQLPEGLALIGRIEANRAEVNRDLDLLEARLNRLRMVDEAALQPVRSAASRYNQDAVAVRTFLGNRTGNASGSGSGSGGGGAQDQAGLEGFTAPIGTLQSDRAASHVGALEVLLRQFFGPDTWFKSLAYLLLAVGLDFLLFDTLVRLRRRMDAVLASRPVIAAIARVQPAGPALNWR